MIKDLELLEDDLVAKTTGLMRAQLMRLLAAIQVLWPGDDATRQEQAAAIARLNTQWLKRPLPEIQGAMYSAALDALSRGVNQGKADIGSSWPVSEELSSEVVAGIDFTETIVNEIVAEIEKVIAAAQTIDDVIAAVTLSTRGINRVAVASRWVVNRSANDGISRVAHNTGNVVVWVAERDACLHCLSYQGEINIGTGYMPSRNFTDKPAVRSKIVHPPLHPNCRCTQVVVEPESEATKAIVTGLKREAERSVMRGFSLPSESEAVRLRGARKLLKMGSNLPKTVKEYGQQAVNRGSFARDRKFPG